MNLGRLTQDARTWRAPLALAAVLVLMQWFAGPVWESVRYDRQAVLAGELWRLLTAHLIHSDFVHLGWNLAGLVLVAWLFGREFRAREWGLILLGSTVAVDLGFLLLEPQLDWYVGFSGVLHGLMAAGLCAWLWRSPDSMTALVATVFAAKLTWEHFAGPLPFTSGSLDLPVVHQSHSYGAVGGLVAAILLLWRGAAPAGRYNHASGRTDGPGEDIPR
jgi:rhomboid family GlyGly-CTERM serine protease